MKTPEHPFARYEQISIHGYIPAKKESEDEIPSAAASSFDGMQGDRQGEMPSVA